MKVLVTGATGFVGTALIKCLESQGMALRAAVLPGESSRHLPAAVERVTVPPFSSGTDFAAALKGIEVVLHLAARVHAPNAPAAEFRRANVEGTAALARQSACAGVRRLVFLSSVKVNGEGRATPYREDDDPAPRDPYSVSKAEAEHLLRQIAVATGLEVVILRPPLVYGPGVKAHFRQLLETVRKEIPLPIASIRNTRSLIGIGNLVDAISLCASHARAAGQVYLVSDGANLSTPELVRSIAGAMNRSARMFPFPPALMLLLARMAGREGVVQRIAGSLTVDIAKITAELGWHPPCSVEQGLAETANWYLKRVQFEGALPGWRG